MRPPWKTRKLSSQNVGRELLLVVVERAEAVDEVGFHAQRPEQQREHAEASVRLRGRALERRGAEAQQGQTAGLRAAGAPPRSAARVVPYGASWRRSCSSTNSMPRAAAGAHVIAPTTRPSCQAMKVRLRSRCAKGRERSRKPIGRRLAMLEPVFGDLADLRVDGRRRLAVLLDGDAGAAREVDRRAGLLRALAAHAVALQVEERLFADLDGLEARGRRPPFQRARWRRRT